MNNGVNKFAAAFAVSVLSVATVASADLVNPGFELDDAQPNMDVAGATGWGGFNSRFTTEQAARTGTQSLKMFGPFFQGGGAGVFQSIPVTPGDFIEASAWGFDAGSADPDGFVGTNFGLVQLGFFNAANQAVSVVDSAQINASAPDQVWQLLTASGVAPAGAVRAQILLLHVQANDPVTGGAVFFDDASLGFGVAPSFVLGDFNFDGGVDASDIDPFVVAANEGDPFAGYIASAQEAFGLLYDGQTLTPAIVNQIGDFNGDGGVDASDIDPFVVFANSGGANVSAIPEPAALGLLAPMGLLLSRRRR